MTIKDNRTLSSQVKIAAEGELKLLGFWPSVFAIRVRMVLEQKGMSYEYLKEDLLNKSELLLKYNPVHKKIPVLIHGDRGICESLVILQYINEKWPGTEPPVLPVDPYECVMARFWAYYIDDKLLSALFGIMWAATEEERTDKIVDAVGMLGLLEGAFEKCSGGKDFFGGDSVGFLDVALGFMLGFMKALERIYAAKLLDETKVPLLVQWAHRFLELGLVKCAMPSMERLEEYGRNLLAKWKDASTLTYELTSDMIVQ